MKKTIWKYLRSALLAFAGLFGFCSSFSSASSSPFESVNITYHGDLWQMTDSIQEKTVPGAPWYGYVEYLGYYGNAQGVSSNIGILFLPMSAYQQIQTANYSYANHDGTIIGNTYYYPGAGAAGIQYVLCLKPDSEIPLTQCGYVKGYWNPY